VAATPIPETVCIVPAVISSETERIAGLEHELVSLRVRLTITRLVAVDIGRWVDDGEDGVDLVVDDVLRLWRNRDQEGGPADLAGPGGLWNRYADRVEFAPPDGRDEFRAEFCMSAPEPFNADDYYGAVWGAHVADLRAASRAQANLDPLGAS
jgi:hypothetical protein